MPARRGAISLPSRPKKSTVGATRTPQSRVNARWVEAIPSKPASASAPSMSISTTGWPSRSNDDR